MTVYGELLENINIDEASKMKISKKGDFYVASYGNWEMQFPDDIKDESGVKSAIGEPSSEEEFVGSSLYVMQQTGGKLLLNGKKVKASNMKDTSGKPLKGDTELIYGGKKVKFSSLMG